MKWMQAGLLFISPLPLVAHALVDTDSNNNEKLSTYQVSMQAVPNVIQLNGVIQAISQGTVAAQTSGTVVEVFADANDQATKGQMLLKLSNVQQTAELEMAKSQLASARATFLEAKVQLERLSQLAPQGAISPEQLDQAKAREKSASAAVSAAKAAIAKAQENLGYTEVKAPYAGVVTARHVELGESVTIGTPLFSGFAQQPLRVEAQLPQKYRYTAKSVEQFRIYRGDTFGTASFTQQPQKFEIFPYAEQGSHSFKLRLDLPENSMIGVPGEWVKVDFQYGQTQRLLVPQSSVIRRGDLSTVYRLNRDGKAILNPVRIGERHQGYIEVISGLSVGDQVILFNPDERQRQKLEAGQ